MEKVNEMIEAYRQFTSAFEGFSGPKPTKSAAPVTGK